MQTLEPIFYDIETYHGRFLFIAKIDGEYHQFDHTQLSQLRKFITANNERMWVSYNGIDFDNRLLKHILYNNEASVVSIKTLSDKIIIDGDSASETLGLLNFDLSYFFRLESKSNDGAYHRRFKALKTVASELNIGVSKFSPVPFDQFIISDAEWKDIIAYCKNDVDLTEGIFNSPKIQGELIARKEVSSRFNIPLQTAFTKSSAALAELCILNMIGSASSHYKTDSPFTRAEIIPKNLNLQSPNFQAILKAIIAPSNDPFDLSLQIKLAGGQLSIGSGGVHFTLSNQAGKPLKYKFKAGHDQLIDVDVNGYYPNLVRTLGIGPSGIEKEYANTFKTLLKLKDDATSPAQRECAKLILNSGIGKLKEPFAKLFSPKANLAVTLSGQLIIIELFESLHMAGFKIVGINTDGLTALVPLARVDEYKAIIKVWEDKWDFTTTMINFESFLSLSISDYYAVADNKKIKTKGCFIPDSKKQYPAVTSGIINTLETGTDIITFLKTLPPQYFTKTMSRDVWVLEGDGQGFEPSGNNTFYLSTKYFFNQLFSKPSPKKKISVAAGVGFGIPELADIDFERYKAIIEKECKNVSTLSSNIDGDFTIMKPIKLKKGKEITHELLSSGMILTLDQKRANFCPLCEREGRSVQIFEDGAYCHACQKQITTQTLNSFCIPDVVVHKKDTQPIEQPQPVIDDFDFGDNVLTTQDIEQPQPVVEKEMDFSIFLSREDERTPITTVMAPNSLFDAPVFEDVGAGLDRSWGVWAATMTAITAYIHDQVIFKYHGPLYPQVYMVVAQPTSTGKGVYTQIIKALLKDTGVSAIGMPESGQAMFTALADTSGYRSPEGVYSRRPTLGLVPELTNLISKFQIPNSTFETELLNLFQNRDPLCSMKESNFKAYGRKDVLVKNPIFSLFGTTTVEGLKTKLLTDQYISSGLVNRFFFVPQSQREWLAMNEKGAFDFDTLSGLLGRRIKITPSMSGGSIWDRCRRDPAVAKLANTYINDAFHSIMNNPDLPQKESLPFKRLHVYLFIFAINYMVLRGEDYITMACMQASITAIEWSKHYLLDLIKEEIALPKNVYVEREILIEERIINYIKRSNYLPMKKTKVLQILSGGNYAKINGAKVSFKELGNTIKTLLGSGIVRIDEETDFLYPVLDKVDTKN